MCKDYDIEVMMYGERFDICHARFEEKGEVIEQYMCFSKDDRIVWQVNINAFKTKEEGYDFAEKMIDETIKIDEL